MTRTALAVLALATALTSPALAQTPPAIAPDPTLTPGAVRTTDAGEICATGTRALRHWSRERDDRIMAEYALPPGPHPDFEIDHLIPLGIGGSDDDLNLWPEPRRSIEPVWNAEAKDRLEWKLRDLVCSGELDAREAQREIADDWTEAYRRTVGVAHELRGVARRRGGLTRMARISSVLASADRRKATGWTKVHGSRRSA